MMNERDYIIAGLRLRLTQPHFAFRGLDAFRTPAAGEADIEIRQQRFEDSHAAPRPMRAASPSGSGTVTEPKGARSSDNAFGPSEAGEREIDTFDFRDADADCRLMRLGEELRFTLSPRNGRETVQFRLAADGKSAVTNFATMHDPSLFRFGLWMIFNLAAAARHRAAVHASAICCNGSAVLFLGESGTGKSTHTRLWRECIPGAELLNDDSPLVGVNGGAARVFGSPWSGKTPCYRNLSFPVRAFVRLSQGPENRIRRLPLLQAYGALQPSFPPSFAHDPQLADRMNALLSDLLGRVPVYHLSCRPDAGAARLAYETVYSK